MAAAHARQPARSPSTPHTIRRSALLAVAVLAAGLVAPVASAGASISDELAAVQAEADALAQRLSDLQTEAALAEARIADLEVEGDRIRDDIEILRVEVRQVAVDRYVNAGNQPTAWTPDPLETARRDVLLEAVQDRSNAAIEAFRDAVSRLDRSTDALQDQRGRLQSAQDEMAGRLADLHEELARLAELQRRADLEAARQAAERRQEELRLAAAAATTPTTPRATSSTTQPPATPTTPTSAAPPPSTAPPSTSTSTTTVPPTTGPPTPPPSTGFLCPVKPSSFIDSWGFPRSGGRTHKGVDMLAPIGTPAIAPVSGLVQHRGNSVGGLSYHLYGDDGNYYYGTHLSAYGQAGRVEAGTVIGYVGDTGNAAGIPHLHFEIHRGGAGNAINPYPTVRAAC